MAIVDAVVREAAMTEGVAGDDARRLYGNAFAGSTSDGWGYSCQGPREVIPIIAGEVSARGSRRLLFVIVSKSNQIGSVFYDMQTVACRIYFLCRDGLTM